MIIYQKGSSNPVASITTTRVSIVKKVELKQTYMSSAIYMISLWPWVI